MVRKFSKILSTFERLLQCKLYWWCLKHSLLMEQLILRILLLKATSFAGIYFKAKIKILIFFCIFESFTKKLKQNELTVPSSLDFVGLEPDKSDKDRLILYFLSSTELWDLLSVIKIPYVSVITTLNSGHFYLPISRSSSKYKWSFFCSVTLRPIIPWSSSITSLKVFKKFSKFSKNEVF